MIPLPWRLAGLAALILGAFAWLHFHDAATFKRGAESVRAELHEAQAKAQIEAAAITVRRIDNAAQIDTRVLAAKRGGAAVVADAHSAGDGLRVILADRGQPAAGADPGKCSAERADARQLAYLLGESSRLLEEGAGIVAGAVPVIDGFREREQLK